MTRLGRSRLEAWSPVPEGPDISLNSHKSPELRYYSHSTDQKPELVKVWGLPTRAHGHSVAELGQP